MYELLHQADGLERGGSKVNSNAMLLLNFLLTEVSHEHEPGKTKDETEALRLRGSGSPGGVRRPILFFLEFTEPGLIFEGNFDELAILSHLRFPIRVGRL